MVLDASRPVGNYWMRVIGASECTATQNAIIRYEGASDSEPETSDQFAGQTSWEMVYNLFKYLFSLRELMHFHERKLCLRLWFAFLLYRDLFLSVKVDLLQESKRDVTKVVSLVQNGGKNY